jgi:hypothetical protein
MARIRTIKPSFFKNEELADLPMVARLLFIGLWTLADKEGRLENRPKRIKAELFPYDNLDCEKELSRLQSAGFIIRYEFGDLKVIQITNFTTHQRITGKESETDSVFPAYSEEGKLLGNNGETFEKQLGLLGKEKEGNKEWKGKDESASPQPDPIFSIEQKESFIKFQTWIKENTPRVGEMKEPFTIDQYFKLIKNGYNSENIRKLLAAMHNWKPLLTKNLSAYLTLIKWNEKTI